MELIPIIYTVLEIVVALTIITLTVSYIASRMRNKRDMNVTSTGRDADLLSPIVIDSPAPNNPRREDNDRKHSALKEPKPASKLKQRDDGLKPVGIRKENNVRRKENPPGKDSHKDSPKRKAEEHSAKPKIKNERLSILTNLSSTGEVEETPKTAKIKNRTGQVRTLGDEIIDKYMEGNENDMFTLKVTNKGKQEDKS